MNKEWNLDILYKSYESEEFQEVFGKFDLENYKPSRQVKEQKEKEIAMPKHNHSLWKEDV